MSRSTSNRVAELPKPIDEPMELLDHAEKELSGFGYDSHDGSDHTAEECRAALEDVLVYLRKEQESARRLEARLDALEKRVNLAFRSMAK